MNKNYRVVWNETTGTWAAVPEFAKAKGKGKQVRTAVLAAFAALGAVSQAQAATVTYSPTYGLVDNGNPTYTAVGIGSWAADPTPNGATTGYETAFGYHASASQAGSTAVGGNNSALSIGTNSNAKADYSQAIGNSAVTNGLGDTALGGSTTASGNGLVGGYAAALGSNSIANGAGTVAIGANANASTPYSVALGSNSVTAAAVNTTGATIAGQTYTFAGTNAMGTVSVGGVGTERTITNVAAGRLTATSTDAVNGSQLYSTNSAMGNLSNSVNSINGSSVHYDTYANGSLCRVTQTSRRTARS